MKSPFPQRRPLLFVGLLLLVILVIYFVAGAITIQIKLTSVAMALMADGMLALIAIVLLTRHHWWREVGYRLPSSPRSLRLFIVPCLPIILNIAFFGMGNPGVGGLLLFLAAALLVGFVEETYFRGMMLRALLGRGSRQAVIVSSLLFGVMHLLNVAGGANLEATLLQVVYAVAIGLMYAALALRTRAILPLIVIHGLTDFFAFIALNSTVVTSGLNTLFYVVSAWETIIYAVYSIILMRQMKPQVSEEEKGTTFVPPVAHEVLVSERV
jgi:uncharacterized protein